MILRRGGGSCLVAASSNSRLHRNRVHTESVLASGSVLQSESRSVSELPWGSALGLVSKWVSESASAWELDRSYEYTPWVSGSRSELESELPWA